MPVYLDSEIVNEIGWGLEICQIDWNFDEKIVCIAGFGKEDKKE